MTNKPKTLEQLIKEIIKEFDIVRVYRAKSQTKIVGIETSLIKNSANLLSE